MLNEGAVKKPPVLHTTVDLQLGDLFINKYHSTSYNDDVLQVWLLKTTSECESLQWIQVHCVCANVYVTD